MNSYRIHPWDEGRWVVTRNGVIFAGPCSLLSALAVQADLLQQQMKLDKAGGDR